MLKKEEERVSFKKRGDIGVDSVFERFVWCAGERNRPVIEWSLFVTFLEDWDHLPRYPILSKGAGRQGL